jgi:hypothetical protein
MLREADATLRAFWILSLASLKVSVAAAGWAAYSFDFDFDFFVFSLLCGHRTRELFVDLCEGVGIAGGTAHSVSPLVASVYIILYYIILYILQSSSGAWIQSPRTVARLPFVVIMCGLVM